MDEWQVGLLNGGEILEFTYIAYSEVATANGEPKVTLRKKDWIPQYVSEIKTRNQQFPDLSFLEKNLSDFTGKDVLMISIFISGIFAYFGGAIVLYFFFFGRKLFKS
jgi:hypothetical protein